MRRSIELDGGLLHATELVERSHQRGNIRLGRLGDQHGETAHIRATAADQSENNGDNDENLFHFAVHVGIISKKTASGNGEVLTRNGQLVGFVRL